MSEPAQRLFFAAALPEEAREQIRRGLGAALPAGVPGRAVPPRNWHLTLRFLGDTAPDAALAARAAVRAAELGPALALRLSGLGAFPRPDRARVLWLGVAEGAAQLAALAAAVEAAVRRAGLAPEPRPFAPHLTLSRLRAPADLRPLLAAAPPLPVALRVPEIVLYRSRLGGGPAQYEVVERFGLGEA